jgi:hypothetical protein
MSTLLANFDVNSQTLPAGWVSLSGTGVGGAATQNGITLTVEVAFSGQSSSGSLYDQGHYDIPEAVLEGFGFVNIGAGTVLRISGLSSGQSGFIRFGGGSINAGRHRLLTVDGVTYQHDNPGGTAPITPEPPVDALFVADASGEVAFTIDAATTNAVFPYFQVFAETGPSITTADNITTEGQTATFTLSGNTSAPTSATLNGTDVGTLTDQGSGVYSFTAPLIADDDTADLVVSVDGTTAGATISYANSLPYALTDHAEPDANSVMFGNQFGTTGAVELAEPALISGDAGAATIDWASMDAAQGWTADINTYATANSDGTQTWEFTYLISETNQSGTFQRTLQVGNGGIVVVRAGMRKPMRAKLARQSLREKL